MAIHFQSLTLHQLLKLAIYNKP